MDLVVLVKIKSMTEEKKTQKKTTSKKVVKEKSKTLEDLGFKNNMMIVGPNLKIRVDLLETKYRISLIVGIGSTVVSTISVDLITIDEVDNFTMHFLRNDVEVSTPSNGIYVQSKESL